MSEWSYLSPQVVLGPLSLQGGVVPQLSTPYKPSDRNLRVTNSMLDEEKESVSSLPIYPSFNQFESYSEDPSVSFTDSLASRDDSLTHSFGNSLNSQGGIQNTDYSLTLRSNGHSLSQNNLSYDSTVLPTSSDQPESLDRNIIVPNSNSEVSSSELNSLEYTNSQSETNSSNLLSSSDVTPNNPPPSSSSTCSRVPSQPTILSDQYIILDHVDSSTSRALHIKSHQQVHVKSVCPRTVREVCGQQALLGEYEGARAPIGAVISQCGRKAWLIFPPHYGDLHSYVRLRRRLRETEAQRLFAQVAATVGRCHEAGLVLRDLKLRKFVFMHSNRKSIVLESVEDSVVVGESDLLHDKHGCPAYVAPEILSAASYSGRHADMWSLGVILYTMLVGRYPFHNADTSTLFARIRSGKFFMPEWVSSRARHLILSLLRRQPHRRLSAHQVLLHPWLNRPPRDHASRELLDHVVPSGASPVLAQKNTTKSLTS